MGNKVLFLSLVTLVIVDYSSSQSSRSCSGEGSLRLVGGSSQYEGRVEICVGGQWGTVCDDFWGAPDARVVCRQLQYSPTGSLAFRSARYGSGTGSIHLDDVQCVGNEARLLDCRHITNHNCGHSEDASVQCAPRRICADGDIRLRGGFSNSSGRVEVCKNNAWGTVCDDRWSSADAQVVCRQLGFSTHNATALGSARFGAGTGSILMDEVRCTGSEGRLVNCRHTTQHDCSHSEDASVICYGSVCEQGEVRLTGNSSMSTGRLEVCLNNVWGTVCDDFWGSADVSVACSQLGYSRFAASWYTSRSNTAAGLPIHLDDVACVGSEARLINCRYDGTTSDCNHSEDVYIRCQVSNCMEGAVRLANGNSTAGRVEVCYQGSWGTVCDDRWGNIDAGVVCRQLGFSRYNARAVGSAEFGSSSLPIKLDEVRCSGTESSLVNCNFVSRHDCSNIEDAGVICNETLRCASGDLRLAGSGRAGQGRVEVCVDEAWGTVCDSLWDNRDAQVVCRRLGFPATGSRAVSNSFFGGGSGSVALNRLGCRGNESSLLDCSHVRGSFSFFCTLHTEDAGVRCATGATPVCSEGFVRLVNGTNSMSGRVEICRDNSWGTVCDDMWDSTDAGVVCRQLGFTRRNAIARSNARFGRGVGSIHLDDVRCSGTESRLLDCTYNSRDNCNHAEDAGVVCSNATLLCEEGALRLVGGVSPYEGRVEVCDGDEEWGTVCDDGWSLANTRVVCRQLNFTNSAITPQGYVRARYGAGIGTILLDDVRCRGSETRLIGCTRTSSHNCGHSEDVGVRCSQCIENSIRLRGGSTMFEGRVEVCLGGGWGTVCDDGWSPFDGIVTCRQLGFNTQGAILRPAAFFGQGTGLPIAMDDVRCTSIESRLTSCRYRNSTAIRSCTHREDAGIVCRPPLPDPLEDVEISNITATTVTLRWTPSYQLHVTITGYEVRCSSSFPVLSSGNVTVWGNSTLSATVMGLEENTRHTCCVSSVTSNGRSAQHCETGTTLEAVCEEGALRLVGGVSPYEGRVEVCGGDEEWGTVCDDLWSLANTRVVCRQLNFTNSEITPQGYVRARYGAGVGTILLDDVRCRGSETRLIGCTRTSSHNCGHSEDVGVRCSQCVENSIRLRGGSTVFEGRVEVCLGGGWGTVCDDGWSPYDGIVTCRQLGFDTRGAILRPAAFFGQGTGLPIAMDDVRCTSRESQLTSCRYRNSTAIRSCTHREDAGIVCRSPSPDPLVDVGVSNITATTVTLRWTPSYQLHVTITGYEVRCSSSFPVLSSGNATVWGNSTLSATVMGLEEYTRHTCCVSSVTSNGRSAQHCETGTTLEAAPSEGPSRLAVTTPGSTSLSLSWSAPPLMGRNGIIRRYSIRLQNLEDFSILSFSTRTTTYSISPLRPYSTYNCSVAAETSVGRGPYRSQTVRTPEAAPFGPPLSFEATTLNSMALELTWNPPQAELRNGVIRQYVIDVVIENTDQSDNLLVGGRTLSFVLRSLRPSFTYTFTIRAVTVAQGPSANVTLKLPEDRPSLAPVNFVAFYDESRPTTVQLAWRRVPVEGRNGIIIGYLLTVTDEIEGSVSVNVTVTELSYEIRDLMPNAAYNISVAGLTSVGPGPAAYDLVKTIQLDIAPAPQLGSISRRSAQEIEISWSAVVDDKYPITSYVVKYRPITTLQKRNAEDQAVLIETNETSLVISDLDPRIAYGVSVAARNRAGLGNFTEEALTELYSNSRFQVHMSGAIVCIPWLSHNGDEKQKLILSALAAEISKSCSCPFSVNYIGRVKLSCGDGTTDRVVLEGTIVALPETSEEELHKHLQSWVDTSPTLEVAGVQLTLVKCSTYPSDSKSCELEGPLPNVATSKLKNDGSSGSSVFLYSGVGVGVLVVLILACFTIGLVWAVRRKRRQMKIRRLTLMATSPTTPLPGDIVESKLDDVKFDFQDSDSHIYESPDDLFSQIASKSSGIGDYSNSFGKGEPYQVPQPGKSPYQKPSSAPVRNGPNGCQSSPVAHARGYDVPRGTDKKQLSHMDFLTKPKPVENVYEDAAGTRLEGKGSTASGGGRLLEVARTSCRTSGFSPGQRNAADPHDWKDEAHDEDQYIEMNPTVN